MPRDRKLPYSSLGPNQIIPPIQVRRKPSSKAAWVQRQSVTCVTCSCKHHSAISITSTLSKIPIIRSSLPTTIKLFIYSRTTKSFLLRTSAHPHLHPLSMSSTRILTLKPEEYMKAANLARHSSYLPTNVKKPP